ncbi:MAG: NAD(P)-dependent oxidoreductase [Terriglobales bacterium]|jgi:nucleoside-diphosphate-sugar epimerase
MHNVTDSNGNGRSLQNEFALSAGELFGPDDPILITGASGFIGIRLVRNLLDRGFRNLRCLTRLPGKAAKLEALRDHAGDTRIQVLTGNLLAREDCAAATRDVKLIYHLAAGRGEKSFPDAYMNSVVATRNLIEAAAEPASGPRSLQRLVTVSSFAVYSNRHKPQGNLLDESCSIEAQAHLCGDAYSFAKIKQDEIVAEYCNRFGIPYVIVRPGYVLGPGNPAITGRVGIGTFGIFMHLGGFNSLPITYVDNCADAIALAGLKRGVEGQAFNVVDDDLPSSWKFLRAYKRNVRSFKSIYVPHWLSYTGCYLWERYSTWSEGQLDPVFNHRLWHRYWKRTRYSNRKLKTQLGWTPKVDMTEGLRRYFESCGAGRV